jgi:hypothetical protein
MRMRAFCRSVIFGEASRCDHGNDLDTAMAAFLDRFKAEQKARTKRQNDASKERKRARELAAALARGRATGVEDRTHLPDGGTARPTGVTAAPPWHR